MSVGKEEKWNKIIKIKKFAEGSLLIVKKEVRTPRLRKMGMNEVKYKRQNEARVKKKAWRNICTHL